MTIEASYDAPVWTVIRFRSVLAVPVVGPEIGIVTVMLAHNEMGESRRVPVRDLVHRDANTPLPIGLKLDNPSETP